MLRAPARGYRADYSTRSGRRAEAAGPARIRLPGRSLLFKLAVTAACLHFDVENEDGPGLPVSGDQVDHRATGAAREEHDRIG
jgi:hypothetical protein